MFISSSIIISINYEALFSSSPTSPSPPPHSSSSSLSSSPVSRGTPSQRVAVLAYVGRDNGGNTQVVYSIYFLMDVEDATIISVALRVLALEKKDDIQIGDQQYSLVGNTGIFNALNETQTDSDGEWTPAVVIDTISLQQSGGAAMRYWTIWGNSNAHYWTFSESSNTGDTGRAAILEILVEQQYWRYWQSSSIGDTGRAAILEILVE